MIVFDLKCGGGHVFEAWFASTAAYEDQRGRSLIACPVCGGGGIEKAVMAPRVGAKGNQVAAARSPEMAARAMLAAIAAAQAKALPQSTWVGRRFAEEARAIHEGNAPLAIIHGQATPDEAQSLADDGIAAMPLLVPVAPPERLN